MHLPAASFASLYVLHSGQVIVADGVGSRPCSDRIWQRMAWHGLRLLAGVGVVSAWARFRFLLLDRFLFGFGGGGAMLSFFLRIVFVIFVCIWTGC